MFEIIAGSKPGALQDDTTRATLDGAVRIVGKELRAMPACLPRMNSVQRCLLELILCDALVELRRYQQGDTPRLAELLARRDDSLEPGRGSGIPATPCEASPTL